MKKQLLLACMASALTLSAQNVVVGTPQQLLKGVETAAYMPVLSKDGSMMLYNIDVNKGLKMYSFADDVSMTIENGDVFVLNAGFDGTDNVTYDKSVPSGALLERSAVSYNMNSHKAVAKVRKTASKGVEVSVDGSKLLISINGTVREYTPVECHAGYLCASVSPNGKYIAFQAGGKGVFITDLEGKIVASLGKYEFPAWCGNDYVVVQNATDDGHQLHSSQILLLKSDGSQQVQLTKPVSMSLNPTASADGSKVVYNTIDGRLYMINLKYEK